MWARLNPTLRRLRSSSLATTASFLAAAVAGYGVYTALSSRPLAVACQAQTEIVEAERSTSWLKGIMEGYENRLRRFSHPLKIFKYFASVERNGTKYMTPEDFITSLLPFAEKRLHRKKFAEAYEFFKLADVDGDGLISYKEYLLFTLLLKVPENSVRVAFKLFDGDKSGSLDRDEFLQVLKIHEAHGFTGRLGARERIASTSSSKLGVNPLLRKFFGEDGTKTLSFEEFAGFLGELKSKLLELEFAHYSPREDGTISARSFGTSLLAYIYDVDMAKRLDALPAYSERVSFEQFREFNKIFDSMTDIVFALRLYSESGRRKGGLIEQADLRRAFRLVSGKELPPVITKILFGIFDTNGDGTLDEQEFLTVLESRRFRGLEHNSGLSLTKVYEGLVKCMK